MTALELAKYHATGNDFLVTVAQHGDAPVSAREAVALCDRHRGVGADGLITLGPAAPGSDADCTFHLRNADGGEAEMSGNGMRCLAALAARRGLGTSDLLRVDTAKGRRDVTLTRAADGTVVAADVDMGAATFVPAEIPFAEAETRDVTATIEGVRYDGDAVGMGNPHWVLRVDDLETIPVAAVGPRMEHDARFPQRTNVEWVVVHDRAHASLRVWERGVGETLSCGTGACAASAALHRRGLVDHTLTMRVPGGELSITIGDTIRLGGPVTHIFDVTVDRTTLK